MQINDKIKKTDAELTLLSLSIDIIDLTCKFEKQLIEKINNFKSVTDYKLSLLKEKGQS